MPGPSGARRRQIHVRALAVAMALGCTAAAAGCGLGAGEGSGGEAALTVTRDYGAGAVIEATIGDPAEADTVIRVLDREAEITTRHGGGFVQSIEGVSGGTEDGRSHDWFFYVNGIESPVGAADAHVEAGDRIWWDHHDWTDVMRVPAVVGSFPQPFEAAGAEDGRPIEVGCAGEERVCEAARSALEDEGVEAETVAAGEAQPGDRPRLLVGELEALGDDPAASLLRHGPERSGVFARFTAQDTALELLDERAGSERSGQFGLVAATARGAEAPTWVVTGTDPASVAEAAELLSEALLHNRFAVAVEPGGETIPLPAPGGP